MINLIKKIYFLSKIFLLLLKLKNNLNDEIYKKNIAKKIRVALEQSGPIFIKLGQILSTRIDSIPLELIKELKKLQTNTKFISFNEIKKVLNANFDKKTQTIFEKINQNPIASASIAQIHTAISKKKEKLIIKIIKPGIKILIKKDIFIFKIIANAIHIFFKKARRLKPLDLATELNKTLDNELNLKNEAINLIKIKTSFNKNKKMYIPKIKFDLTTKEVLVLEYIDGIHIINIKKIKKIKLDAKIIIKNLLNLFYKQSFKKKIFHADLHPGNILISKNNINNPVIILLDFGISGELTKKEKQYLAINLLAFSQKKYRTVAKLHLKAKTIQTPNKLKELENELYFIFEPILNKKIKNISFQKTMIELINLSKKINLQIQPNLILFQKTLLSIESISRQLDPSANLWQITRTSLEKLIIKNVMINKIKNIIQNKNKLLKNKKKLIKKSLYKYIKVLALIYLIIIIINNLTKYKILL